MHEWFSQRESVRPQRARTVQDIVPDELREKLVFILENSASNLSPGRAALFWRLLYDTMFEIPSIRQSYKKHPTNATNMNVAYVGDSISSCEWHSVLDICEACFFALNAVSADDDKEATMSRFQNDVNDVLNESDLAYLLNGLKSRGYFLHPSIRRSSRRSGGSVTQRVSKVRMSSSGER